ncbi:MAG: S-adenosylmethionine--2-demethylmenaquinone methyltransferase [Glaciihabitans sp.]|nr:S-adenosylmethionine--2-demethylmenaquinone methyltransferase [Glaciihabitans sp.]
MNTGQHESGDDKSGGTPRTADLVDIHGDDLPSCELQLVNYGGHQRFSGPIVTFQTVDDNLLLKQLTGEPGQGRVIVVDAGGSLRTAMLGGDMAARAANSGWAGIVIHGAVRDSVELAQLPIGIKALGTNPRRSKKAGTGQIDVEVDFGSVHFAPGFVIVSDEDGIVVLPQPTT